mmetsp:Transcript_3553/g.6710  ORF Transcript_3553/g.6710 Transcript_3553/m.6710 type:complete len:484 (+) Transcript_3553:74-1525(+)
MVRKAKATNTIFRTKQLIPKSFRRRWLCGIRSILAFCWIFVVVFQIIIPSHTKKLHDCAGGADHQDEMPLLVKNGNIYDKKSSVMTTSADASSMILTKDDMALLEVDNITSNTHSFETGIEEEIPKIKKTSVASAHYTEVANHMSKEQQDNQDIAVFYNTYIGINTTRSLAIIEEQLKTLNAAWGDLKKFKEGSVVSPKLYYSLFGNISNAFPKCGIMDCSPISVQFQGNELVTLQFLYECCTDNPMHHAIYIHNKGSFTISNTSELMRKVLMTAVTSMACLQTARDRTCDSCSSQLLLYPTLYYPGNMFIVKCEYASKLIPPKEFESAKQRAVNKMLNATIQKGKWYVTHLRDGNESDVSSFTFPRSKMFQLLKQPAMVGTGRYAMEHWLGSHPDYKPCHVFNESKYGLLENIPQILKVAIDMGLEPNLEASVPPLDRNQALIFEKWLVPYFTKLWGRFYLYKELYGKVPDINSWMYSYFDY